MRTLGLIQISRHTVHLGLRQAPHRLQPLVQAPSLITIRSVHRTKPQPTILVFHGISMSRESIHRELEPLFKVLIRKLDCRIEAVNGGHIMSPEEVQNFVDLHGSRIQDSDEVLREGRFWRKMKYDWFNAIKDPESGGFNFRCLQQSLANIEAAAADKHVVGILGFSQGAAMAAIAANLAKTRAEFLPDLKFGVFVGGFCPEFSQPASVSLKWPVSGLPTFHCGGELDKLIKPSMVKTLAGKFQDPAPIVDMLLGRGHTTDLDEVTIERIAHNFIAPLLSEKK